MSKKVALGPNSVKLIDISSYQRTINLAEAKKEGIECCFSKASEGTSVKDATFKAHNAAAKAAGMLTGSYHFFHFTLDPVLQAENFCNSVAAGGGCDFLALDVEWADGYKTVGASGAKAALECLAKIKALTGKTPFVYTAASFFIGATSAQLAEFKQYPLWIANYGVASPTIPEPWDTFAIWQRTDKFAVAGLAVDGDVFNGTLEELKAMAGGAAAQPSQPEAVPDAPAAAPKGDTKLMALQTALNGMGESLTVDGIAGAKTKAALTHVASKM